MKLLAFRTKNLVLNYESRLHDKIVEALERVGMFRGVAQDASSLGKSLSEIIRKLLDQSFPPLPKVRNGVTTFAWR